MADIYSILAQKNTQTSVKPVSSGVDNSIYGLLAKNNQMRFGIYEEEDTDYNKGGLFGGIGYTLGKLGTGAFGILEGIWDYTAGGVAKFFGADEWAEEQFANNIAGNWNQDLDDWYNPSSGMKVVGDVASGIGNSLVGMGAVAGAAAIAAFSGGSLSGLSASIIAGVTIGLGAAGMATTEAYEKTGQLGGKEFAYGALSGITEAALEGITGAAGKVGGKLFAKQTAKTVAKKTILKGVVSNFAGEAFEEGVSEILTPYFQRWTEVDPEAKNATWQQVGYAALVGGLSGALLGGIGDAYTTVKSINRGNVISKNTQHTEAVLGMARNFAQYETEHNTGREAYQYITGLVNQFDALDKGDGTLTIGQKKILGQMEVADVVLSVEPAVQRSKENIIANAQQFIDAVNARGLIDASTGKPIHIDSVEALVNNDALLTQFAVADSLGQLLMSKDSVYDFVVSKGKTDGIMQADFRNFQKEATAQEKASINELFGIDVDSITYDDFINKIQYTNRQVIETKQEAIQTRKQAKNAISQAINTNAEVSTVDNKTVYAEGMSVYKTKDGKYISVSKKGEQYYLYADGNISQPLTKAKLKAAIKILNGEQAKARVKEKSSTTVRATATQTTQEVKTNTPTVATTTETEVNNQGNTKPVVETAEKAEKANKTNNTTTETKKVDNAPKSAVKKETTKVVKDGAESTSKNTVEKATTEKNSDVKEEKAENTAQKTTTQTEKTDAETKTVDKQTAKKSKAPNNATARRKVLSLVMVKTNRESLRGAATKGGKQYVSDGFFVVRYDSILEGATEVSADGYPFNVFDKVISDNSNLATEERVEIDADAMRGLVPQKRADYVQNLARIGENYYQIAYLSKIIDSLSNPQVFLKKSGKLNPVYIKGDNGEAVLLPIRVEGGRAKPVYEVDYAVSSKQETTPQKTTVAKKESVKKTTAVKENTNDVKSNTDKNAENVEKTINGKTYKDFTAKEFESLISPLRDYYISKNKKPNAIVFAQLGDFYEAFFNDAEMLSNDFDITLKNSEVKGYSDKVKMISIPVEKFEEYKTALNKKGLDVVKVNPDGLKVIYKTENNADNQVKTENVKTETKKTTKTEDFGEKIGGARKDTWQKRGLLTTDLTAMNRREMQQHVKKENVWKRPDFVKAVAEGGDRGLLYAQNELYKSLNATPYVWRNVVNDTTSTAFQDAMEKYISEVREVQKIAESIKTKEDLGKITNFLIEKGYLKDTGSLYRRYSWTESYYESPAFYGSKIYETARTLEKGFDSLGETALIEGFGVDKADKLPNGYTIRRVNSYWDGSGTRYIIVKGGKHGSYASPYFNSFEDALAYGKEKYGTAETATTSTDGKKRRFVPEQLKDVHRNGLDYRTGKNATGDDFLRDFGIKGGEFGNWLSEVDRTTSLNYGYDAFCDLADALNIELKDISLNGTLSIGFGSRGQGLSGAAAHYEPARKVINLTKMNGAGSLAHEFWHAVEDYASGDTHQSDMASDFSKMPERTKNAGKELLNAINYKNTVVSIEEINENKAKNFERYKRHLTSVLDYQFKIFSESMTEEERAKEASLYRYQRTPNDADLQKYKSLRERALKGEKDTYTKFITGKENVADELNALLKEVKGRGIEKETRQSIASYVDSLANFSEQAVETQTNRVKTQFHEDAIAISRTYAKDGGYWDSNSEMLARAFASYIHTKTNGGNDYLSGHALSAAPVVKNGTLDVAYIYPHDTAEAEKIYKAFDNFFDAAKADGLFHEATREKPKTNIQYAMSEDTQLNTVPNGSKGQKLKPLQMKHAESVARGNIKGYDSLTEAERLEVEWTLASAWRAGKDTAEALKLARLSTAIGAGVGFADLSTKVADGKTITPDAACYTMGGHLTIYLNPNGKRTVESATLHELVHSLEGVDGYDELKTMAEKYYDEHPAEKKAIDDMYRDVYKNEQVKYAEEVLPSELTAHYVETMLAKRDMLAKLTQEKPTFTQKCIEKIKAIRKKLTATDTSADMSEVDMLEKRFTTIFNLNKGKIANKSNLSGIRLGIKTINGKDTVIVDTDQHIFDGVERADLGKTVSAYMKERYRGRIVNGFAFTAQSEREYTYSRDSKRLFNQTNGAYEAKMRASTELNNLIVTGEFMQDEIAKHTQAINEGGIKRYKVSFIMSDKVFEGEMIIAINKNGVGTFYDIVKIKESDSSNDAPNGVVRTNALSTNSIVNNSENVNTSQERFALDMTKKQEKTSAATSINSKKLPVLYGKVNFEPNTVNLDIGGGKFDNVTEYLAQRGVKNYIYDPYNRSAEHNAMVASMTEEGKSDTVTISNVLNVIDSLDGRKQVLENAVDAVKPDGTVYITVYEGNGSGVAKNTGADQFQLNRKTKDYLPEVRGYFADVEVKNNVIIAKKPIKDSAIQYALPVQNSQKVGDVSSDRFNSVEEVKNYYDKAIVKAYEKYKAVDPYSLRVNNEQRLSLKEYLDTRETLENQKKEMLKIVKKKIASVDSDGNALTASQQKYFRGSKVVDENGRLKVCYHGTSAKFNEFSYKYLGKNGTSYGKGFYFSDSADYSNSFATKDGSLMKVYLDIKKPLSLTKKNITVDKLRSFLTKLAKYETEDGINTLSDYADIDSYGVNAAINACIDVEYYMSSNDVDLIHGIFNGISGIELNDYYKLLTETLGYDGIIEKRDNETFYVTFQSNQSKNVTNTAPTSNADIRYALSPDDIKGSDRTMTELPDERISFRDVITRKKSVGDLKTQISEDSKEFTEGWQIATTNAQAGLERVLRETGNDKATAITNYVRAGKNAAYGALTAGQFSLDGETYLGESWEKIWKPVYAMDKKDGQAYKMFNLYLLHWHNTDRYAVGKPVFGTDVTVEDSIKAISEIEAEYPSFRKIAEKVWKYNDGELQIAVDSGMYSEEYAEVLREMYPHYVPTSRAEHRTPIGALQGKGNVRVNPNNRRAVGSDLDILPIDDVVAQQTIQRISSARINQMLLSMKNGTAHDEFKVIDAESETVDIDNDNLVTTFADKAKGKHQVTFWENGKSVTAEVSQNVFRGIESFMPSGDTTFNNTIINAVAKANSGFKKLVTAWNPFFVFFKNPIRDLQTALNYTRYSWKTYAKNFVKAGNEIRNNGRYWQEAQSAGILSASVYDYRKGLQYKNKGKWSNAIGKIESVSNAIEMKPRLAEYISARESGLSVQEALLQAQDVTTNFGRSGTLTKKANATFMPFLNPAVQGFSKMVRAYTGKDAAKSWANLIIRSLILGVGMSALNDLLNDDDEEYKNVSDYVKNNNYLLSLGDGQFLKIPKGRENGFIGELYLRAKRYANGEENAWEGTLESFMSNLTPTDNFTRTIFSPFVDISTNSTWYGGTIEGQKWNDTEPKNRYDESTSSISIWLGKVFNYSPIKIDYLLEQYGGVVTDILLPATNLEAETGVITQNMLVNSTTNSRWSTEFYSAIERYTYKKTAGDIQAKGVVKYLNNISGTVSEMYNQKRTIQGDKTLSNDEKLKQVKIIQAVINSLQKDAISNIKTLYEELGKYELADDNFDTGYLNAVSSVVGEEYALKVYNKQVYEKAQMLNTMGIDYGTYFDYYFGLKSITADTNSNGSTVSGSKKANVIAYTMNLNLPTVQKLMLIMSAGYKISDGDIKGLTAKYAKTTVAKYITNLSVSREEKTKLAELFGFTVKSGKIYIN